MLLKKLKNSKDNTKTKSTRIQVINKEKIIDAATKVFAQYGYRGATIEQIAKKAGMSKPNLLYYYRSKKALYIEVLIQIYNIWLGPLKELDIDNEPQEELENYIDRKIEASRLYPLASKIWATEIICGAPMLKSVLETDLQETVKKKSKVLRTWMKQGKIKECDPKHFLFMIWAMTQHYADFSTQVECITGKTLDTDTFRRNTKKNIKQILLHGVLK